MLKERAQKHAWPSPSSEICHRERQDTVEEGREELEGKRECHRTQGGKRGEEDAAPRGTK